MTKAQEIDALAKFIARLPRDSYLWPWLVSVQAQVVADIRNDVAVSPSIAETRKQCDEMIIRAEFEAKRIISDAEIHARRERDEMMKFNHNLRASLANQLDSARRSLLCLA